MNINVTLIVQMIVFATVVWFSMRFIWPLIMQVIRMMNRYPILNGWLVLVLVII